MRRRSERKPHAVSESVTRKAASLVSKTRSSGVWIRSGTSPRENSHGDRERDHAVRGVKDATDAGDPYPLLGRTAAARLGCEADDGRPEPEVEHGE